MKPRILLVTTCRWPSAAQLAMAFADIDCEIEMVCPQGHPVANTRAVSRIHVFRGLTPLLSLNKAINASQPDIILSCDDPATTYLHRLNSRLQLQGTSATRMLEVLERSLGPIESHPIIDARSRLIALARSEGIRAPETVPIATMEHLRVWLSQNSLPAVFKVDGTSGGVGVQIINTVAAAEQAFAKLSARPTAVHTLKQAIFKRDTTLLVPSLQNRKPVVNVQSFVAGRDATSSVACWKGEIVASIHCEVLKTLYARGPASVLQLMDHSEMQQSAGQLIKRLGLSGIYGFDFRLEEHSGKAHLIEMNARATQISHLAMGTGRDLPVALRAMLTGESVPPTNRITEKDIITLFPQEWNSDPSSEFLTTGFHDVPWSEPGLVKSSVDDHKQLVMKKR